MGILFIHFSVSLSTLLLAAWISLVTWFWHLSLWTIDNSRSCGVTIQIESCWVLLYCGTAVYFAVRVVLTFECVDEILWRCDHSNESYWAVFFPTVLFIMVYKVTVVLPFEFLDEILWCDHSNERYWTVPWLSQFGTELIVFFCILQNETLSGFWLGHFWEWMVSEWMVAMAFETARIYFLGWRVFAAVTVVISSLMLLEPFCLPEYKIIGVLQQSYLSKHVQNVLGLE